MSDKDAFLVPNPINRFALGDRSNLTFDSDGSLTLYIQSDSPGRTRDWLPAPKDDDFNWHFGSTRQKRSRGWHMETAGRRTCDLCSCIRLSPKEKADCQQHLPDLPGSYQLNVRLDLYAGPQSLVST